MTERVARHFFATFFHFSDDFTHAGTFRQEDIDIALLVHDGAQAVGFLVKVDCHFRNEDRVD